MEAHGADTARCDPDLKLRVEQTIALALSMAAPRCRTPSLPYSSGWNWKARPPSSSTWWSRVPYSSGWNWKARPPSSSTWWSRAWTVPTQEALIAHLRGRETGQPSAVSAYTVVGDPRPGHGRGPTRRSSSAPPTTDRPTRVAPYPGAPGYEAVATCLAAPEVRARTEGVIAWRPEVT
ncbi:MAG: hypothetical protein WDN31_20025 [Hyphomicrobium sp.]